MSDGQSQERPKVLDLVAEQQRRANSSAPEALPFTDTGNAERLARRHGEDLRYVEDWKRWRIWDGQRWREDNTGEVVRRATDTVKAIGEEDYHDRAELAKHANKSQSYKSIRDLITLAQSKPPIPAEPAEFDRHPFLLNIQNGTIDLRTGECRPADKADLLTKLAPVTHDQDAHCPQWLNFLDRIMKGSVEMIEFLQRAVGYSLTGDVSERCFFILYGMGANGKSTFVETIRHLLGHKEYSEGAQSETLLAKKDGAIPADLAQMKGARFVAAAETAENRRLDEALIKNVTGNEVIKARLLHSNPFSFKPEFKIWLSTNHRPNVGTGGKALFDRVKLIPFAANIPEKEQDKKLPEKLKEEFSGILNWAIYGCLEWQRKGLGIPPLVLAATKEYQVDMDSFGAFLEEACLVGAGYRANNPDLQKAYDHWRVSNNEHELSAKAVTLKLKDRGFIQHKSGSVKWWEGLALKYLKSPDGSGDGSHGGTVQGTVENATLLQQHQAVGGERDGLRFTNFPKEISIERVSLETVPNVYPSLSEPLSEEQIRANSAALENDPVFASASSFDSKPSDADGEQEEEPPPWAY